MGPKLNLRHCYICLLVVYLAISESGVYGQCDVRKFGRDCGLVCHCELGTDCDPDGKCNAACELGWTGPTCQTKIGNVTLQGVNTKQGPITKNNQESPLAVDGDYNTYTWVQDQESSQNITHVYWRVDLGANTNVHSVEINFYNPGVDPDKVKKRRPGFSVAITDTDIVPSIDTCYQDSSNFDQISAKMVISNCTGYGRYVYVINERNLQTNNTDWSKFANLELAEVVVVEDKGCSEGTYGERCELECGHCTSAECSRDDGTCPGFCIEGWYGDRCDTECNKNCQDSICEKSDGKCKAGCVDHSLHGDMCDIPCTDNLPGCGTCENVGGVLKCLDDKPCDSLCAQCKDNNCEVCVKGYFLDNKGCVSCNINRSNCTECSDIATCTECQAGFYGKDCSDCPENCAECSSETNCSSCKAGWEGNECQCSQDCVRNKLPLEEWCDLQTGECSQGCKDGLYGRKCQESCPGNIAICNQDDGRCVECKPGFYGEFEQCLNKCGHCKDDVCDIAIGRCPGKCEMGYYGEFCNQSCGVNCDPSLCNKDTGVCHMCRIAFYGQHCENRCNDGCFDSKCEKDTGHCSLNCRMSWYGSFCDEPCPVNCLTYCSRLEGKCNGCEVGYYGDHCSQACPINCGSPLDGRTGGNICNQKTGMCDNCKLGFYGDHCSYKCSRKCALSPLFPNRPDCEKSDGTCRSCLPGNFGDFCEGVCSVHCSLGVCHKQSGVCLKSCESGWYNLTCDSPCSEGCKEKQCDRTTAQCIKGCEEGYDGVTCKPVTKIAAMVIVIVSIVVVVVVAVLIIVAVVCYRRRKQKSLRNNLPLTHIANGAAREERAALLRNGSSLTSKPLLPSRDSKRSVGMEDEADAQVTHSDPSDYYNLNSRIPVADFSDYLRKRRSEDPDWFKVEFKKLPTGLLKDVNDSTGVGNRGKCRYKNLYPYDWNLCYSVLPRIFLKPGIQQYMPDDWNRVKLEPEGDIKHDFINASYVKGYKKPQGFIAAQGPTDGTINDFWRMIWQKDCGRIVMLTNLFEECKMKCERYWPDSEEPQMYGPYEVVLEREDVSPNYTIRHLQATHTRTKEVKDFRQYHYTTWPDRNVPDNPGFLLAFKDKVMQDDDGLDGPILVHCSAGIGRTGTLIALDYLVQQAQTEQNIDVFRTVTDMRYHRTNFVQTDIQYGFLHTAICEALTTQDMEISSTEFYTYFSSLAENNWEKLREQYESLEKNTPEIDPDSFKCGLTEENLLKNRYPDILPLDTHRAYLSTPVRGSNDYINAVFLPSCMNKTGFLLTQMPLPRTVTDFWRLVYDHHVCNIVMMNNLDDDDESIGEYWPSDDSVYGPFRLELLTCDNCDDFNSMTIQLTHRSLSRETKMKVKLFRYEGWPDDEKVPTSTKSLTSLISNVSHSSKDSSNEPVIVHCMDGVTRSGVYSVVSAVLERLQEEQKVNIPHVVLQLRSRRPQIINSFEQYLYVYQAVAEYITDTQIYSNVL